MDYPEQLRSFAKIDIDNLLSNYEAIENSLPEGVKTLAVVKADAYGHGAVRVSKELEERVAYFAVAEPEEALELRRAGIEKPILILGYASPSLAPELADNEVTLCCYSLDYAKRLDERLRECGKKLKVHIKLDTGMSRLGFVCSEDGVEDEICEAAKLDTLEVEGVFAHYAEADDFESDFTSVQLARFEETVEKLEKRGLKFKYKHHSNSAGSLFGDNSTMNLARAGISLYGYYPSREVERTWLKLHPEHPFKPVMSLYGKVARIMELKRGTSIGYGRSYIASSDRKVAVITLGYADGIPRLISNKAKVTSEQLPIVGRVCMDMFFVDITDSEKNIREEDFVEIFGADSVSGEYIAETAGTISYELTCSISKRVHRLIVKTGEDPVIM